MRSLALEHAGARGCSHSQRRHGSDRLLMRFAINTAYAQCNHLSLLAINPSCRTGQKKLLKLGVLDLKAFAKIRVYRGHHAAFKVQISAILLGNTRDIHERGKSWFHLFLGENENFRRGNWVEPFLDPAPYCGKERWCSNDLVECQITIAVRPPRRPPGIVVIRKGYLRRSDRVSQGSGQWQADWHPACGFSGSKTASNRLERCRQCCWTGRRVIRDSVFLGRQNTRALRSGSNSHTEQTAVAFSMAKDL